MAIRNISDRYLTKTCWLKRETIWIFLEKHPAAKHGQTKEAKKKKKKNRLNSSKKKKKKFQWRENKVKGGLALQEMKYWSFDQVEEEGSLFWLGCSKQ